jgi:acyl-CoA thioesterase-1
MSMIAPYGPSRFLANAAVLLCLLFSAAAANARPIRILVLGDSLTAGYGLPHADGFQAQMQAALKARGHDVQLVDAAVSGDTSAGGRARLDWALGGGTTEGGADAALVELGANDGLRGLAPAQLQANLAAILDTLAARHIPVLLSGMLAPPNLGADYGRAFKAVFTTLGQRPGIIFDPFFLDGAAAKPELNQADGIHPNAQGVKLIVARLLPDMEKLIAMVKT